MLALVKPKLVHLDVPLFMALLSDLFPGLEAPAALPPAGDALRAAVEAELRDAGLQPAPDFVAKVLQLSDCRATRHGNMLVGRTGAGKTAAWRALAGAYGRLAAAGGAGGDNSSSGLYQRVSEES